MFITDLEIENFRGIKSSNIIFSIDSRIICLIGPGDSTKSTILKAIEWILWPSWNLTASDTDFFNCDVNHPIILRGTFTEIPKKLISEDKFGMYLRKPHVSLDGTSCDDPDDVQPICLTIQLTIDETLEPKWEVVCNRKEPRVISQSERKLFSIGNIGTNCSKDMIWGRYSILQKYADISGTLHDVNTEVLRKVAKDADLQSLNTINEMIINVGKQYGVGFEKQIENKIIVQNGSISSSIGLFDGDTPLTQMGTGSQRLLSMGLNIKSSTGDSLLLVDEIETGLEPYRIRSLINEFRNTHEHLGQVIFTTHSPIVVAECVVGELSVVQSKNGVTQIVKLNHSDSETNKVIQAQVRRNAEAFLCKRLIVCEGKTEIGFIRAFDTYLSKNKKYRMAFNGIGTADGGGTSIFSLAKVLLSCGYDICLLMDSDKDDEDDLKDELIKKGVKIFDWEKPNAFEEQVFLDVSQDMMTEIMDIVVDEYGIDSVESRLKDNDINYVIQEGKIELSINSKKDQRMIGSVAKKKKIEWFKRVDLGEKLGNIIFGNISYLDKESKLNKIIEELNEWVIDSDGRRTEENNGDK